MSPIRVLIADDHRIVRQGLRHVCEAVGGLRVVGEAEDGREAVNLAWQLRPDVILMDINMPVLDGVQATSLIVEANPAARVIILTMYRQDRYVFEAIKAGARGYLRKDSAAPDPGVAVQAGLRGGAVLHPHPPAPALGGGWPLSQMTYEAEDTECLTQAEMEVLRLVAQGADNKTIADQLALSERTVANRLSTVYEKLHVHNRTQAALAALRRGWATLDDDT